MTPVTDDPDAVPPRRRRRWILVAVALGVVVALVVLAVQPEDPAPFHEKVAELRAAGFATTHDELVGPAPPEEVNAATELLAAWADLEAQEGPQTSWTVTGPWDGTAMVPWAETASSERLGELADFLERIEPFFARVDAALERPRMWFDEPLDGKGMRQEVTVPVLQKTQRLLHAQGEANQDSGRRLAACATQLRLARRVEAPGVIEVMVAAAIHSGGSGQLRRLVDRRIVAASAARATCDGHLEGTLAARFPGVSRGEIAFLSEIYASWLRGEVDVGALGFGGGRPNLVDRVRAWLDDEGVPGPRAVADVLGIHRECSEVVLEPGTDWIGRLRSIVDRAPDGTWVGYVPEVAERLVRSDAVAAVTRVGLAAAEFRETNGRWPESLGDLRASFPGGVPSDPFTGGPLHFERTADGVRVSSRGAVPSTAAPSLEELREQKLVWELRDE